MPTLSEWTTGGESDHFIALGKIDGHREKVRRGASSFWLKAPYYVADEIKRQLRRSRLVPGVPAKDYKAWAKGETRPPCRTYYDGRSMYVAQSVCSVGGGRG